MACTDQALLGKLKDIVCELEGGPACCPCPPPPACVCPPNTQPFAACCMVCPPPILAPTSPQPVKPLQLPCPYPSNEPEMTPEQAEETRYANFYNNYNIDYHTQSHNDGHGNAPCQDDKKGGVTVNGTSPICNDKKKKAADCHDKGCPTGFKPCKMKLTPPPGCHPCGVWCAEIQPCPPKSKKKKEKGRCC